MCDIFESLLSSSIPDLHFVLFLIDHYSFYLKVNTNCSNIRIFKMVLTKPCNQVCLTNPAITDYYYLYHEVIFLTFFCWLHFRFFTLNLILITFFKLYKRTFIYYIITKLSKFKEKNYTLNKFYLSWVLKNFYRKIINFLESSKLFNFLCSESIQYFLNRKNKLKNF